MAKCQALPEEVQAIEDMIKTIKSPRSFFFTVGKNILVNGKQIFSDVVSAVSEYEEQKWEDFGKDIGDIMIKVFIGANRHTTMLNGSESILDGDDYESDSDSDSIFSDDSSDDSDSSSSSSSSSSSDSSSSDSSSDDN